MGGAVAVRQTHACGGEASRVARVQAAANRLQLVEVGRCAGWGEEEAGHGVQL